MKLKNRIIFVVEDEADIREVITYNIEKAGFVVFGFESAEDMFNKLLNIKPDLVFLDIMLPGMDGLDACKELKKNPESADIPVIMLTAKGEESDVVIGLELGADDYVVKPFSPKILIARMKAVFRRYNAEKITDGECITVDGIHIDSKKHKVSVLGKEIQLTFSEFEALKIFVSNPGLVYTRYHLVEKIHGYDYPVTDRSVDVMIVNLRKKLGEKGANIKTVRGVGYKFRDNNEEK